MFLIFLLTNIYPQSSGISGYVPTIPADRRVDWTNAGYKGNIPTVYNAIFNVINYGAVPNDGVDDRQAIQNTIEAARTFIAANPGTNAIVYFPQGTYTISSGAISLANDNTKDYSNICLKGEGSDKTILYYPSSYIGRAINICGTTPFPFYNVTAGYNRGSNVVTTNTGGINAGDYVELVDDRPLEYGQQIGQIEKVNSASGSQLTLEDAMSIDYNYNSNFPQLRKIKPVQNVGIDDIQFARESMPDGSSGGYTIFYNYAANCWIQGVESNITYSRHVVIDASTAIEITGCYFHDATSHGDGGVGYGVEIENHSTDCLTEDNLFSGLRHSMMVQLGANRNVFGYNYSWNRIYSPVLWGEGEVYPGTGDISVHGNYPYANLFEGNKVELIWLDDYHGKDNGMRIYGFNGPYNTFVRNDVSEGEIIVNSADYTNVVGNYADGVGVSSSGDALVQFLYGWVYSSNFVLDVAAKQYNKDGSIYSYTHSQFFFSSLIQASSLCEDFSYYLPNEPSFFSPYYSIVSWPALGTTDACYGNGNAYFPKGTNPAYERKIENIKYTVSGQPLLFPFSYVSISGPTSLPIGQNGNWNANPFGGYPPFNYQWYYEYPGGIQPALAISPNLLSKGSWYTCGTNSATLTTAFYSSIYLKCVVTDAHNTVLTSNQMSVSIDGAKIIANQAQTLSANQPYLAKTPLPKLYRIDQNFPNPFNPTTVINYQLPQDGFVSLIVYDELGNIVKTLENGFKPAGSYTANFNGSNLASGMYFYRLATNGYVSTKKMILLK